jgi:transposase InsO family protein
MSDRRHADLVCQALQMAYWHRKPGPGLIMHSDRGSQYASDRYRQLIANYRMLQSMSRRPMLGQCTDRKFLQDSEGRAHLPSSI